MTLTPSMHEPHQADDYDLLPMFEQPATPYWRCSYYLTCNRPNVDTEPCSFGCWDEPVCMTGGPWEPEQTIDRLASMMTRYLDIEHTTLAERVELRRRLHVELLRWEGTWPGHPPIERLAAP